MHDIEQLSREEGVLRTVEREDGVEYVVDLGPTGDATVDVVADTAIVVVDDRQYDLDIPDDAEAFIRNGVLTITTEDPA